MAGGAIGATGTVGGAIPTLMNRGGAAPLTGTAVTPAVPSPTAPYTGAAPGTAVQPTAYQPAGKPSVYTQASNALTSALGATGQALGTPLQQANIAAYQNPYTEQVIKANEADILRGAQMGLNELGAQAQSAKAFGGSRQGIAEAELGRNVLQQLAQSSAGLRQAGFTQAQQAAQQDISTNLAAAQQLAGLGNLGFGWGQAINQNMLQQGALQQAAMQKLIDAGRAQYGGFTGAPASSIDYLSRALGATTVPQSQTQPGLFDMLTTAATIASMSDGRLKKNIKFVGKLRNGIEMFTWEWNEIGKKIGADKWPTFGVIAQKLQKSHPDAVLKDSDGWLRVNYNHPAFGA